MTGKEVISRHLETGKADDFDRSWRDEKWDGQTLSTAAQDVASDEKAMSVWEAIRANPSAIAW